MVTETKRYEDAEDDDKEHNYHRGEITLWSWWNKGKDRDEV